ncbi:MAG: hypothetical protein B6U76_04700 [Desulfurococcales archaeon ex4484_217_2]|nr:MAG: hypothetical protein B6U76_04700 [Desulfurococcales archaeon ex4484_217_2]
MADTKINFTDFTNNVTVSEDGNYTVTGEGVFDTLMATVNTQISAQFNLGRLTGAEYSAVYLGGMQAAIAESMKFILQKQIAEEQTDGEAAKVDLIKRQTKGFDDDAKAKLTKQLLDSWSVAYSVAKNASGIPDAIKTNTIDSIVTSQIEALIVDMKINPLGKWNDDDLVDKDGKKR